MNQQQRPETEFARRLRAELTAIVAEHGAAQVAEEAVSATTAPSPWRRRGPRSALGAVAVLAAAAAVFVFSSGSDKTSRAFAVEPQEGGGVTIKIYSAEDAAGLEGALGEAGIRSQVTWLPAGMMCREPRFTPSTAKTSGGGSIGGANFAGPAPAMTIGIMGSEQYRERMRERVGEYNDGEISEDEARDSIPNFSLDPASFRSDQTVVISGSRGPYRGDPEGGFEAQIAVAEGQVEPCEPVKVPDGGVLSEINRLFRSESAQGSTGADAAGKAASAPSSGAE